MIPAPYLTMETALELMAEIIFPPFNFDLVYFSLFLTISHCILSLFDHSFLHVLLFYYYHLFAIFFLLFFLYLIFHLFMLYTIGLQDSKIFVSAFLNILHHLSVGHNYSFPFNYFFSLHDQLPTLW